MCKYYIHVTFTGTNLHIHKFMSVANDKMSIYHRGLETNIDSNSSDYYRRFQNTENMDFNEQMSQRQTFWEKNRNLLFLVAGLVVGCFVTVIISYAFFFHLGRIKDMKIANRMVRNFINISTCFAYCSFLWLWLLIWLLLLLLLLLLLSS